MINGSIEQRRDRAFQQWAERNAGLARLRSTRPIFDEAFNAGRESWRKVLLWRPERDGAAPDFMSALCDSFPYLEFAEGKRPWDASLFAAAMSRRHNKCDRLVAAFVLSVWSVGLSDPLWWTKAPYTLEPCDLVRLVATVNEPNRAALMAWIDNHFFPSW